MSLGKGPSSATMSLAAINAFHERAALPSPTTGPSIRLTLKGIKRIQGAVPCQARGMTKQILKRITGPVFRKVGTRLEKSIPLVDLRGAWFELIAFLTLARFSDLSRVLRSDVQISERVVSILFRTRKNDPEHGGHLVKLYPSNDGVCPIRLTKAYFVRLSHHHNAHVLPQICRGRYLVSTAASFSGMRSQQKRMMTLAGLDPKPFGLHSGRVGGAITLHDSGWTWADIGSFGGWSVGSCMPEKYCKNATKRKAQMSQSLAL